MSCLTAAGRFLTVPRKYLSVECSVDARVFDAVHEQLALRAGVCELSFLCGSILLRAAYL